MPLCRLIDQSLTIISNQNLSLILGGETLLHAIIGGKTFPGKVYSSAPDAAIRFLIRKSGKRQLDIRNYVAILVFMLLKFFF